MSKKIARAQPGNDLWWLVLSGSGMKLYAFLGALLALVQLGYRFKGVTGTSGGAVVASVLGRFWDPEEPEESVKRMIEVAKGIQPAKVLTFRWAVWEWMLTKVFRQGPKGIFKTERLLKEFRKHMPATIGDCKLPVRICSYQVNLKSPVPVLFADAKTDLPLAALGSMNLPVFDPTIYNGAMLQDGGWVRNFNVPDDEKKVIGLYFGGAEAGPKEGVVTDPTKISPVMDNIDLILRDIFGAIDDNMRRSIEEAEEEGVDLMKIELVTSLNGFDFFADEKKIEQAINDGYESVMAHLAT